jgi:DNA-directed RNA polymerase subunit beta
MAKPKRERIRYGRIFPILQMPNLLEVQKKSYEEFLQKDVPPEKRKREGLQAVFEEIFPIRDPSGTVELAFVSYSIEEPKYTIEECKDKGYTYGAPLRAKFRLIIRERDPETGAERIKEIREKDIFLCEIPLMTENGAFIINGTERVIVSQLHRAPGVFFEVREHPSGFVYAGRILPYRGAWIEFELDPYEVLYARLDKKKRVLATTVLKAAGLSEREILLSLCETEDFHLKEIIDKRTGSVIFSPDPSKALGRFLAKDLVAPGTGEVIAPAFSAVDEEILKKAIESGIDKLSLARTVEVGIDIAEGFVRDRQAITVTDVLDPNTGEVLVKARSLLTHDKLRLLKDRGVKSIMFFVIDGAVRKTLLKDTTSNPDDAVFEIYRKMKPHEPRILENARSYFRALFFDPRRYDLGKVGRYKLNSKLGLSIPIDERVLTVNDMTETIRFLIKLRDREVTLEEMDHLGNRRVRAVGELLYNQFRIGFARMERMIRERMGMMDSFDDVTPHDFINIKFLTSAIREFFGTSQLSQFMGQVNPLDALTHKRRLSALGPGGLNRERAGFEARDVHYSHYGRICPVETPEGPNIGLISSLSTYARVNEFGIIETPYRRVRNGVITDEIDYIPADKEDEYVITHSNVRVDENGRILDELVPARYMGGYPMVRPENVDYIDVCPEQIVSVATSLIPFLEHDDANRALMGSNMQRQAVPLVRPEAPIVGTGMEARVGVDSGVAVIAKRSGVVEKVTGDEIIIRSDEGLTDRYKLVRFGRSNQRTCIDQRPIVREGERVEAGEVIADGPAMDMGELALGVNVLVAFMPWEGYNFEDAIVISERLIKDDVFTSIHIEEFEVEARETKLGKEEITRDIPNLSEEALANLDENGIVRIGAEVKPGDILVGKVAPRGGEVELTPEEKLLRAIFGERARDVKDASFRVPSGVEGKVIGVKVFSVKERDRGEKAIEKEKEELKRIEAWEKEEIRRIRLERDMAIARIKKMGLSEEELRLEVKRREELANEKIEEVKEKARKEKERVEKGDELPPGILSIVKVYVASRRKISVGDKISGRHGNKGVVAAILPEEDMPFLPDGTPVDVILNPLGVPSRMNLGQILETHLGLAAKKLGIYIASPVFDGIKEEEVKDLLEKAGYPRHGQMVLYDGRTGERFDEEVTVGYMYLMKLIHLVDDKMHARSTGPYSLVTQQPLGGKAQFGGQRFGEMEVWALEAYGAAHILQEMLTVKSDDVAGRAMIYESIVKGEDTAVPGVPEAFNVLAKELQGLGLDVKVEVNKEVDDGDDVAS